MIRGAPSGPLTNGGWPRTSGDDPYLAAHEGCGSRLAPHERG